MSDENKDQTVGAETPLAESTAATAEAQAPETGKHEPVHIELEDLTAEGKAKTEEALGRKIADIAYTLTSQETRPGSIAALHFEVARDVFQSEQGRLLNDLRKEVVLPGFRKGKAPIKLLQIRMGEDANRDTVRALVTNALRQEVAKQPALKFIARPQINLYTIPEAPGAPVSFEVEGETEPKVEANLYKGLSVEVEVQPVTDEAVGTRLDALRRQNAVIEPAGEGATINPGDTIAVDIEVANEAGERIESHSRQSQLLHNFQTELPEPVAAQLVGKKVGETVTAGVESQATNRRGEPVTHTDTYTVTVREIKLSKLPELDDEFAKDLGDCATLEDLRAKTRKELEEAEALRQRNEALAKLYHQLVEKNPVDTPRSLLSEQAYRLIMEDQYQLSRMGLKLEQVIQDPNKYMADQRRNAEDMVKIQLLLDQIAKTENLQVSDEDVEQEIAEVAEKSGRKPLAVRARLEAQKQLDQFRQEVGRRKLADFLLANNTIDKVAAKPAPAPEAPEATDEEGVTNV